MSNRLLTRRPHPELTSGVAAVVLLIAWLTAALPWLWMDLAAQRGVLVLGMLLGGACALVSLRSLMPATLVLIFLAADALGVFGYHGEDNLPFVQVMAGVRLTIRDALLVAAFPLAVRRLAGRREVPVFARPLLGVAVTIGVAFLLGVVTDGNLKAPLSLLRQLFGYALYVVVVAAVDSRRKLTWLLATIFGTALLAVAIQVIEAARGAPLEFLALPAASAQALVGLSINGRHVAYIWNHAPPHLFLSLMLGLGCLLDWRAARAHAGLALACAVGFGIQLARSWYIFIAAGVVAMVAVVPAWTPRLRFLGMLGLGTLVLVSATTAATQFSATSYSTPLLDVWLGRAGTLLTFQEDNSYQTRVAELGVQWQGVLGSPFIGYGLSGDTGRLLRLGNLDTGAINTLIMFGLLGTAVFVMLAVRAAWVSVRLARRLPPSRERGYAIGLVGVWVGVLVGYAFNYDFLTGYGCWLVVLALSIGDRVERFALPREQRVARTIRHDPVS